MIAKNRKWGKDFWNDLVGPTLKADMDVETWIRGKIPPILDSDGVHKTYDIKFIDLRKLARHGHGPKRRTMRNGASRRPTTGCASAISIEW